MAATAAAAMETRSSRPNLNLTSNDSTIISQIFDPESAPTAANAGGPILDPSLPSEPLIPSHETLRQITAAQKPIIQSVEAAMRLHPSSESSSNNRLNVLERASQSLRALLETYPGSASLRNDLVQVLRLRYGDELLLVLPSSTGSEWATGEEKAATAAAAQEALRELNTAAEILTPATPQTAIAPAQCRTLAAVYMQRGALFHAAGKKLAKIEEEQKQERGYGGVRVVIPSQLPQTCWTSVDFAEAASRDFFLAGRCGSELGRALAVHTNPTAKLCGQMVKEAMKREYAPSSSCPVTASESAAAQL